MGFFFDVLEVLCLEKGSGNHALQMRLLRSSQRRA
jgi:hypothetical protein